MVAFEEGIELYRQQKYKKALECFSRIEGSSKDVGAELAYYVGLCYARLEKFDNALVYLEQVVTADTDIARLYQCRLILAYIYTKTGRTRLAEFELSKLLGSGYESAQVYASLGFLAYEHNNLEKSIEYYQKAVSLQNESATALNGLGYVLADADKNLTKALALCKTALNIRPNHAAYLDSLAWVYHKLGFSQEAQNYIKKALEQMPENKLIKEHKIAIMMAKREAWQK